MKKQTTVMGMPAIITVIDSPVEIKDIQDVFDYFLHIDEIFSTYKPTSDISKINNGTLTVQQADRKVKEIYDLCEKAKKQTKGYFDMHINGHIDPSGIVKGYAISKGAQMLREKGFQNFYIEIAGDMETNGVNENPFDRKQLIKVVTLKNRGIATSGNYIRGKHIFNPIEKKWADDIASISVIGPTVLAADTYATAAFAMGIEGISFIQNLHGFEGYMITKEKMAYYTDGFEKFVV